MTSTLEGPLRSRGRAGERARRIPALVGFVVATQAVGVLGALTPRGAWYDGLELPSFNPPSWVFAPVWIILYVLMAVAAWRIWCRPGSPSRTVALRWWIAQLVLNAAWSPVFFGLQRPGWALVVIALLLASVTTTCVRFLALDRPAGVLFLPYLAWVAFATLLNAAIVGLN